MTDTASQAGFAGLDDFSKLKLRKFLSRGFGLILKAPKSWQDRSDENFFQVVDPETGTQFTASGYKNSGASLQQWSEARLAVVDHEMPYLSQVKAPYSATGINWTGIAAEYRGIFPDVEEKSHYLVLCLHTEKMVISLTVTAQADLFAQNEALYRWLLEKQLDMVEVIRL
jgi:hypothetical protein